MLSMPLGRPTVSRTRYSPRSLNVADVRTASGGSNFTSPGPERFVQAYVIVAPGTVLVLTVALNVVGPGKVTDRGGPLSGRTGAASGVTLGGTSLIMYSGFSPPFSVVLAFNPL